MGSASADQIEFVDLMIEHLTEKDVIDPKTLCTSSTTDVAPSGSEQVFSIERTDQVFDAIDRVVMPTSTVIADEMRITVRSLSNIGVLIASTRKSRAYSQQEFADLAGVCRRFSSELGGKTTAEIGKVFQVLTALGIDIERKRQGDPSYAESSSLGESST